MKWVAHLDGISRFQEKTSEDGGQALGECRPNSHPCSSSADVRPDKQGEEGTHVNEHKAIRWVRNERPDFELWTKRDLRNENERLGFEDLSDASSSCLLRRAVEAWRETMQAITLLQSHRISRCRRPSVDQADKGSFELDSSIEAVGHSAEPSRCVQRAYASEDNGHAGEIEQ